MDEDIKEESKPWVRGEITRMCYICGKIFEPETDFQKSCTECYKKRKWKKKENDKI